jgi:epoxyqueuosine reductase
LSALFAWTEADFLKFTEGSPIRRIGHERWLRNIAVAFGNARRVATKDEVLGIDATLQTRVNHPSEVVREHVAWALAQ